MRNATAEPTVPTATLPLLRSRLQDAIQAKATTMYLSRVWQLSASHNSPIACARASRGGRALPICSLGDGTGRRAASFMVDVVWDFARAILRSPDGAAFLVEVLSQGAH